MIGFDDEAPQSVTSSGVCPPDDGIVFRPNQMLSAFKGENIQGVWVLKVAMLRNESLSPGALESWKLEFCSTQTATPPVLVKNDTLKVPPGQTNPLTQAELLATDASTPADQLRFTIVRPPAKGQLKANGVALTAGDQFTQATINAFSLSYTHGNGPETEDAFTFVVENGKGGFISTKKFHIAIDPNAIVDVEEVREPDGLRLYPNPADALVYATWDHPVPEDGLLELVNLQGQGIRRAALQKGQTQIEVSTAGLPSGIYLLRIKTGSRQRIHKIAVQH
ncbi:MAG: T9SS type A sorting domain-containing protein [Haliscomenobacter sp.]|nr:T9SS type A sorting domain-containing protein [Haliscomenobacter sp.]